MTWDGAVWGPYTAGGNVYRSHYSYWAITATFAGDADTVDGYHAGDFARLGSSWAITGNSGTDPAANFIGTTDNVSFTVRVNNTPALQIVSPMPPAPTSSAGTAATGWPPAFWGR